MRAATIALRAGRWLVGIAPASRPLHDALVDALAEHVVPDVEAPATYRLRTSPADGSYVLRQGCATLLRTPSLAETTAAVEDVLHVHASEADATAVQMEALAMIGEDGAIVIDAGLRSRLVGARDRLAARGLRLQPTSHVSIETGSGALRAGPYSVEPGPHPVTAWAWRDPGHDRRWPWTAEVVRQADARVRNRDHVGAQPSLDALAASVDAARAVAIPVPPPSTGELLDLIRG